VADLRETIEAGKLHALGGFGAKSEAKLLQQLKRRREVPRRFRLDAGDDFAKPLLEYLKHCKAVLQATIAGSYRRRKDTVGDLDIVVAVRGSTDVMTRLADYDEVDEILAQGETRATVMLRSGLQVDVRVVSEESFGSALHYFIGSKAHNIAVRKLGLERGLKINEYGVFRGTKRVAGETEESVYARVGLPFIPPELREDRGEIAAAAAGELPRLIELEDVRGDLHAQTRQSDGKNTLKEMAQAARSLGYEYLAVTDHSRHATIAHGLDDGRLSRQIKAIDKLNATLSRIRIPKSAEVDILPDGSLDPMRSSPSSTLRCPRSTTSSICRRRNRHRAMDNKHFNILAHPTGRLLGERPAYAIDFEKMLRAAKERGCFVELNANPKRLDADDHVCRRPKDLGIKISVGTDAHSIDGLQFMRYGIGQARRGWLEAKDVLNTHPSKN
jgi:DNA polymerase (family 10)